MIQAGRPSQLLRRKPWVKLNQDSHVQGEGERHDGRFREGLSISYISHVQNASQGRYVMAISLCLKHSVLGQTILGCRKKTTNSQRPNTVKVYFLQKVRCGSGCPPLSGIFGSKFSEAERKMEGA